MFSFTTNILFGFICLLSIHLQYSNAFRYYSPKRNINTIYIYNEIGKYTISYGGEPWNINEIQVNKTKYDIVNIIHDNNHTQIDKNNTLHKHEYIENFFNFNINKLYNYVYSTIKNNIQIIKFNIEQIE